VPACELHCNAFIDGGAAPALETTQPVPPDLVASLPGRYGHGDREIEVAAAEGQLFLTSNKN
jgi:hypothetical protein